MKLRSLPLYFIRTVILMFVIALIIGCARQYQPKQEVLRTFPKSGPTELVYQMWEKTLIIRQYKNFVRSTGVPDVSDVWQKELDNLYFGGIESPSREDFENCRASIIQFLREPPPRDDTAWLLMFAKVLGKFNALFVDFEIDGERARNNKHPELAESIDKALALTKEAFLLNTFSLGIRRFKEAPPTVRLFVEYLLIYNGLVKAKERPVGVQAMLLAMRPKEMKDTKEKTEFTALHRALLQLSRSLTNNDANLEINRSRSAVYLLNIQQKFAITDEELSKVGVTGLLEELRSTRKLPP